MAANPSEPIDISAGEYADYRIEFLDADVVPTYAIKQKVNISDRYDSSAKITKYAILDKKEKKLASVSKKGVVTCKKAGEVTVTAYTTIKNGKKKSYEPVGTYTLKIEKPVVSVKTLSLKAGSEASLNANDYISAQKAQITSWHTSKRSVATIDENTGAITVLKKGSAKITAWYGEGKNAAKYSFTLKVTKAYIQERTANSTVAFDLAYDAATTVSVTVKIDGVDTVFSADVSYRIEDPAAEDNTVKFTVSFDTKGGSEIGSVKVSQNAKLSAGSISKPTKEGYVFFGWYTDEDYTDEYDFDRPVTGDFTLYARWVESQDKTVATQDELEAALGTPSEIERTITFSTSEALTITVAAGSYPETTLVVDAPNTHFENYAEFKSVTLKAVSDNTYVEGAVKQLINIVKDAVIKIVTKGTTAQKIDLSNDGRFDITLNNPVDFVIKGKAMYERNNVRVEEAAQGSSIRTAQNLDIEAKSKIRLVIDPTANNTIASISNDDAMPDIEGIGSVQVTNVETGLVENVQADSTNYDTGERLTVKGRVEPESAEVYIVNYNSSLSADTIETALSSPVGRTTLSDGEYSFSDIKAGNYYIVTKADGYVTELKSVFVPAISSSGTADAGMIRMTSIQDSSQSLGVYGYITDIQTNVRISYPVRLRVYRGIDVTNGTPVKDVVSIDDGSYNLGDLPKGNYTLQVTSENNDTNPVVPSTERLIVKDGMNNAVDSYNYDDSETNPDGYEISIKSGASNMGEISYVLWWNHNDGNNVDYRYSVPSDLDSHLVGPAALESGKRMHTWYADREDYGYESRYYKYLGDERNDEYYGYDGAKYADLDRDDTTWHGPETTTIYKRTDGVYKFYVLNFSSHSDLDDTSMTNYSDAYVQIFVNGNQIATYDVPYGQSGPLWYVCDFNATTGIITPVNSIMTGRGDGGATIGMTDDEALRYEGNQAKRNLNNSIERGEYYLDNLGVDLPSLREMISSAKTVYNNASASKSDVENADNELSRYFSELPGIDSIKFNDGTSTGVYVDYDHSREYSFRDYIYLYDDRHSSDIVEALPRDTATQTAVLEDNDNAVSGKVIKISDSSTGIVRIIEIRESGEDVYTVRNELWQSIESLRGFTYIECTGDDGAIETMISEAQDIYYNGTISAIRTEIAYINSFIQSSMPFVSSLEFKDGSEIEYEINGAYIWIRRSEEHALSDVVVRAGEGCIIDEPLQDDTQIIKIKRTDSGISAAWYIYMID